MLKMCVLYLRGLISVPKIIYKTRFVLHKLQEVVQGIGKSVKINVNSSVLISVGTSLTEGCIRLFVCAGPQTFCIELTSTISLLMNCLSTSETNQTELRNRWKGEDWYRIHNLESPK